MATVESILLKKGPDIVGVLDTASVREAVGYMSEANVGCVLVESGGEAQGIFTERDLLKRVVNERLDPDTTPVKDVMSAPVKTCVPSDDIEQCAHMLQDKNFRHLVVMDNDEPVGVISLRDLVYVE